MRKFFIILFIATGLLSFGQKANSLLEHYQNEYRTFKEFIKYSEAIQGDTNIDVKFYYIDIEIGIWSPSIEGNVSIQFAPLVDELDEVQISLNSALTVDDVLGASSSFYQDNDMIVITLDDSYGPGDLVEVSIFYSGIPVEAGGYKGLRYETHGSNEPIIATLSTPYLAHYWYPCKDGPEDKPDSVYMDITISDEEVAGVPLMAVSNGVLENTIDNGDTKTFQWRHRYPIVTYYVMAAISNYVFFDDEYSDPTGTSFPLDYYVFENHVSTAQAGVAELPDAIAFFSEVFGPYPFANEKYGMTQLGFYGAIENQTNTIQNNLGTGWFSTTIHELGHMWFGDMITLANWHHGWLNEGFATYSEALWDEHKYGFNAYKNNMSSNEYWGGGTLYLENAADTFNTFQSIFYSKGAYAVHMIRGILGDEQFFESLLVYATDPAFIYSNASTADLQESLENSSGMDFDFFFDQWIYDEYWPHYYFNYESNSNNEIYLVLHQAQEDLYGYRPVFEMPVQVKYNFSDGTDSLITVWNDEQTQYFYFNFDKEVTNVLIDPDRWILRKVQFNPNVPVSVEDNIVDPQLELYPNPFSTNLHIKINQGSTALSGITIYNLEGHAVKEFFPAAQQKKSMMLQWDGKDKNGTKLSPGIYLIEFNYSGRIITKRVVMN